jgi:flagellar biosynthesis protein FlhF
MKIKKYLAKSVDEALSLIKRDLGPDAYILAQNKVTKKGNLNLSRAELFEVTAAVDRPVDLGESITSTMLAKKYSAAEEENQAEKREDHFLGLTAIKEEIQPLRQEVEQIRRLLLRSDSAGGGLEFRGLFLELYLNLVGNGVEADLSRRLIQSLQCQVSEAEVGEATILKRKLFQFLVASLTPPAPLKLEKGERKIVVLVGPTGVGKTTTMAKMASYYRLLEGKRVGMLTVDTYRIGAERHAQTYAEILELPFYPVYNAHDLEYRLSRLNDYELVFVDTTGRGTFDRAGIAALNDLLSVIPRGERVMFLLISATTKWADIRQIYDNFSVLQPDKLIFSKIDETCSLGNLFNLRMRSDMPVAYFTTGQRVPEDIEIASTKKFVRLVLHGRGQGVVA